MVPVLPPRLEPEGHGARLAGDLLDVRHLDLGVGRVARGLPAVEGDVGVRGRRVGGGGHGARRLSGRGLRPAGLVHGAGAAHSPVPGLADHRGLQAVAPMPAAAALRQPTRWVRAAAQLVTAGSSPADTAVRRLPVRRSRGQATRRIHRLANFRVRPGAGSRRSRRPVPGAPHRRSARGMPLARPRGVHRGRSGRLPGARDLRDLQHESEQSGGSRRRQHPALGHPGLAHLAAAANRPTIRRAVQP